jgi:hypothetical protein
MIGTVRVPGLAVALVLTTATALAQEPQSRADALRLEREQKAGQLVPPQAGALERTLLDLERGRVIERLLNPPEGLYPRLGNMTAGSGLSIGPGYRHPELFGGSTDLETFAVASFYGYWMLDARLRMPRLAQERVYADIHARRYNFPEQEFFGIGPDSNRDDLVTYGLKSTVVGGSAGVRPRRWLDVGGGAEWLAPTIQADEDPGRVLSIFPPEQLPGALAQPDFMRYEAHVEANSRQPRPNPRRGVRYRLGLERYEDVEHDRFSFNRVEADVQHYIPFLADRRVIALRARATVSDPDAGATVPFYLLTTLGGPDDLRGFRRFRFRDRHSLLLQAEYRWEVFTAMDAAIFYDAGKVASRVEDLNFRNLESDYGIGFRFGTVNGVFLRVEGAFGSHDGPHLILRYGHVF